MQRTLMGSILGVCLSAPLGATERPNILWLTSEDNGPHLGAYGDAFATTPNLDALAGRGAIYLNAWSTFPVCAPARTAIITGMYPSTIGAHHMRSVVPLPSQIRLFPHYLRQAGYYTSNNRKEDYNLERPGTGWDESSARAHWNNRPSNTPFFAVFNHTVSHESRIRERPHQARHDPAGVDIPSYHPDTPEVRQDWAQYYDRMTEMDAQVGERLRELDEAGLTEDTIIFYFGDHGAGMPRSKRWPYNSGLHVPLIVVVPEKFRGLAPRGYGAGAHLTRLVGFIDLAPTILSLAGVEPPGHMQGSAFSGPHSTSGPAYQFGFRDRMDERYDLVRTARDQRYIYIRNYMPHLPYGQHVEYMFQTPTTQVWKRLYDQGVLQPPQTCFWESKPPEELYDLKTDPDQVHNLVDSGAHRLTLVRFRRTVQKHLLTIRDLGFLPEDQLHARSRGTTPFQMGQQQQTYPLERILEVAGLATSGQADVAFLLPALSDPDAGLRYWGVLGLQIRGKAAVSQAAASVRFLLEDPAWSVRIAAAQSLARFGAAPDREKALSVLERSIDLEKNGYYVVLLGLNAIDALDEAARSLLPAVGRVPADPQQVDSRLRPNLAKLVRRIQADLD